ncbi:AMIN domain-containing protein [Leptothoe spongobia]|uniref:AMIN domain-containing protein n=1 Tax=Leptothoe spongobia TAU-MAC 1115 TaxID=1967444 RepID=A0A947DC73_9CYAN|nr:AMIN domain-containing protein [Leptothoe spongobia]MBT9314318.1 AMIN domain-containing protein [Leptothoe spongobia TAU-MAC 1115]
MADESPGWGEFLSKIWVILDKVPYALTFNRVISVLQVNPMGFKHRLHHWLGGSFASLALTMSPAVAEDLQNWSFDVTNSELTFSLSDTVFPEFFLLSEPPRLVLDIPETEIGNIEPEQIYSGAVQSIRVAQHTPEQVRVVIELSPDIVLASDQADIQFDDSADGQRHWRFRPLIADGMSTVAVDSITDSTAPDLNSSNSLSVSAANLELSPQRSTSTPLPIDPYDAASSTSVVSVPPLEDTPTVTVEVSPSPTLDVAAVPDLPPMTVPDLEEPTSLPDISVQPDTVNTTEPLNPDRSPLPKIEATVSGDSLTTDTLEDSLPVESDDVVNADPLENSETAEVAVVSEPPIQPTETVLAPVEVSSSIPDPQLSRVESRSAPAPQTIQQPAATRTIMQTDVPKPLTFGQPLPINN